jgi:hypothetical protein
MRLFICLQYNVNYKLRKGMILLLLNDTQFLRLYSVGNRCVNEHGVLMLSYWQGKIWNMRRRSRPSARSAINTYFDIVTLSLNYSIFHIWFTKYLVDNNFVNSALKNLPPIFILRGQEEAVICHLVITTYHWQKLSVCSWWYVLEKCLTVRNLEAC